MHAGLEFIPDPTTIFATHSFFCQVLQFLGFRVFGITEIVVFF